MDEIIQITSSQNKAIDASNNNNSLKLSGSKPPLLPKPQIVKLESGTHRAVKINNPASPGIAHFDNSSSSLTVKANLQSELTSSGRKDNGLSQKPPCIAPKPQLPPKLNLNGMKTSITSINNLSSPRDFDRSIDYTPLTETVPMRPPRSPFRSCKSTGTTDEQEKFLICSNKLTVIQTGDNNERSSNNETSKNELIWNVQELLDNVDQLSEFCKQVGKCSKHSHLLKDSSDSSLNILHWKKRLEELDLASSSASRNRNIEISGKAKDSGTFFGHNNSSYGISPGHQSHSTNYINGLNKLESNNTKPINLSNRESPKSFLHSYISLKSHTKEAIKNEVEVGEKAVNAHSFLHKNREQQSCLTSPCSGHEDETKTSEKKKDVCTQDNADKNCTDDKEKSEYDRRSDHFYRTFSTHSDGSSFTKRFPWFGSFGKGGKKEAGKKGRCISQFYSPGVDMEEDTFRQKARTKSLPDIKHTRIASDGSFPLKNAQTPTNSSVTTISNEFGHSDSDDDKDSLNQVDLSGYKNCNKNTRAFLKAKELMTSEEVFIDVLKLLNVDFKNFVQLKNFESKTSCIPMAEVNKILNHLSQLQSLNEDILEDLRKRIDNWDKNPKISDVIVKKGAFLKMYTTYIQNFESQTNHLDECMLKYPKFCKIVKDFEASDRCKKLTLKHYMLKPVQRIPQYRLLLNDYLKHLDESSIDYVDTQNALKIVCEVVDHANRNLAHGDKEGKLMRFQSILSDYSLIKPGRELIKDGPLEKICRKSVKDRYFLLLNDCLLHTTYSKQYMKIHQELPLAGMKILSNDDQLFPNSFTVHSIKRSFILCAKNEKECKDWVEKLQMAIEEYIKKQKTFLNVKIEVDNSFKLGKEAPVWVPDSKVTMCQICTAEFTALFRRHHCRGCGKVVCRNCGSNQAPLQYSNFKADRVCDQCYNLLLKDYEESEESVSSMLKEMFNLKEENVQSEYLSLKCKFVRYSSANSLKKTKNIPQRLKEVSANDSESTISGWLYRKSRKSWKMFWYVLKDHVLYVYKASEDVLALQTIPVLGYEVERSKVNDEELDKKLIFSLVHPSQSPLVFRAESQSSADRWFEALTAASNFDHMAI